MTAARRSTALSTVITVMAVLGMTGCQDKSPTDPTVTGIALKQGGGGGKDPKVESTDPTNAPQGTTLDVQVFGSSFDNGSEVTLTIGGTPSELVHTNSTTFIGPKKLIANITIDLNAITDLYDVEVLSSRGRKGIGADLFSVTKKGNTEPEFVITTTDMGTLEGSSQARASSVVSGPDGNSVRVVGESGSRAFYWTPGGGMVELAVLFDPNASLKFAEADEINDAGQIAGERFVDRGDPALNGLQAIFWNSSTEPSIDLTTQARSNYATAINSSGAVVGQSFDHPDDPDAPHQHAMLWTVDGGTVTTQDLLEDFKAAAAGVFVNSVAEGINDRGQIVGWANNESAPGERAFLWDDGVVTFLDGEVEAGFLSFAYAINNADPVQIVGGVHDQTGGSRRVLLWTVSGSTVLTEELPPLAGFDWAWPTDLNDAGEVVGQSSPKTSGKGRHATLWTFAPNTTDRIVVDLGIGGASGIDNSAPLGLTRVVGFTTLEVGKGRKKTRNNHAILWEIVPPISQ